MRLTEVEIKNFCQIAERHDTFEPGVICIRGRNGAGKSNYMKALLYALTGSSSNAGKKEDDLKWGEEKGHVRLGFSRNGVLSMTACSIAGLLQRASLNRVLVSPGPIAFTLILY